MNRKQQDSFTPYIATVELKPIPVGSFCYPSDTPPVPHPDQTWKCKCGRDRVAVPAKALNIFLPPGYHRRWGGFVSLCTYCHSDILTALKTPCTEDECRQPPFDLRGLNYPPANDCPACGGPLVLRTWIPEDGTSIAYIGTHLECMRCDAHINRVIDSLHKLRNKRLSEQTARETAPSAPPGLPSQPSAGNPGRTPKEFIAAGTESCGVFKRSLYSVRRLDGMDSPGGEHEHCRLFVLDITHDPAARAALDAYQKACQASNPELAARIRGIMANL